MKVNKHILLIAGIAGSVLGITIVIPSMLTDKILAAVLGSMLLVFGLVLIALSFGE